MRLFVREVRPEVSTGPAIALIHGARVGGEASFDLDVPGGSLAADLASGGLSAYVVDLRGYGRSDRPLQMREPADSNPPLVRTAEAARDLETIVEWICDRAHTPQVAMLGWATGGHWAGYFATLRPDRVSHLVLLNSLYGGIDGHPTLGHGSSLEDPEHQGRFNRSGIGAWADATAASLLRAWAGSFADDDPDDWRDPLVADTYARTAIEADPDGPGREPPALRVPTGALEDSFYLATGRQLWDASLVRAATLVVRGTRDFWSRPEDADRLMAHLVDAPLARRLDVSDATHFLHLDRPNRGGDRLLREVLRLLAA